MNTMKLVALLVVTCGVLAMPRPVHAANDTGPQLIGQLGVDYSGTVWFSFSTASINYGCPNAGQIRFFLTTNGGHQMYSVLLAAKLAGKPVSAYVNGCRTNDGFVSTDWVYMN